MINQPAKQLNGLSPLEVVAAVLFPIVGIIMCPVCLCKKQWKRAGLFAGVSALAYFIAFVFVWMRAAQS